MRLCDAKEIKMDAAVAAVSLERDGIFTLIEEQRTVRSKNT